ncbi:MAG TPA: glycosyltransferase, partial [Victivallales bacterium]|nr:glycosyltransferase [Victivallales bacterium]
MLLSAQKNNPSLIFPFHEDSSSTLNGIIEELEGVSCDIMVVDDCSVPPYETNSDRVSVIRLDGRLGKGSAIMSAVNIILRETSVTSNHFIVTADSDGQHPAEDIRKALELCDSLNDQNLIISGSRDFSNGVDPA